MKLKNLLRLVFYPLFFIGSLYFGQNKILLHPYVVTDSTPLARPPLATAWLEENQFHGLVYEPDSAAKGTALLFHGNAGAAHHRDALSKPFIEAGYRLVLLEYPGFGERTGTPTITNVKESALRDFGLAHAKWPGPLYVIGESLGAGIAAQVAGNNPDLVSGVLLFTPWDSLGNVVDKKFFGLPIRFLLDEQLDSMKALKHFPGTVSIIAAKLDTLIPHAHAKTLAKAIPHARYLELKNSQHNDWNNWMTAQDWVWALDTFKTKSTLTPLP